MKQKQKQKKSKPRRHASEREAFSFGAVIDPENPDWLVGAD